MNTSTLPARSVLIALVLLPLAACESLPGEKRKQGAVIGGVAGAAAGAVLADEDDRLLGGIIGGALGAGGGYVIGRELEEDEEPPVDPEGGVITAEQVHESATADVDGDGNVTIGEVVALEQAGLSDREILRRLRATGVEFRLTEAQKSTLRDRGVSENVVEQLDTLRAAAPSNASIGR